MFDDKLLVQELNALQGWVGRVAESTDIVTASPLVRMSAWLDREDPIPRKGDAVPPGWHYLFCLSQMPQRHLTHEGGTPRSELFPPISLPRSMWVGCRFTFSGAIKVGDPIRRVGTIKSLTGKTGRTGPLILMTIRDEFLVPAGLAVAEEMDIIFRKNAEGPEPLPPPQPRPGEAVWRRVIQADPPFLFRYSALTYNSHRIHYDLTYTTKQEGYPALLVHGPLQVNLMLELVRQNDARPIAEFSCRAQRPVFEGGPFSVEGAPTPDRTGVTMWVLDRDGALSMTASVKFA